MTEQDYAVLSFYDDIVPKEFQDKDVTIKMELMGIGRNAAYGENFYLNIIAKVLNAGYIKLAPSKKLTKSAREAYLLTEKGKAILNHEKNISDDSLQLEILERRLLELNVINGELSQKNLQLSNDLTQLDLTLKEKEIKYKNWKRFWAGFWFIVGAIATAIIGKLIEPLL